MTSLMDKIELLIKKEKSSPERKKTEPAKSSNEILSELFGAFNAAPPKIEEITSKKSKKGKKKHKKDKKKRSRSSSSDDSDDSDYSHKHKKRKKSKSKKRSRDSRSPSNHRSRSPKIKIDPSLLKYKPDLKLVRTEDVKVKHERVKVEPTEVPKRRVSIKIEVPDTVPDMDASLIPMPDSPHDLDSSDLRLKLNDKKGDVDSDKSKGKIQIKNLKFSAVFEETVKQAEEQARKKAEKYEEGEYTDSSNESVEEIVVNSQFPKSPSGVKLADSEKKRLLEVARRNAINMLKNGEVPGGAAALPPHTRNQSVDELTDFCKHLSKKEALGELSSVCSEDEDMSENEDTMAFHHPFLVKEKAPIIMNIRSTALVANKDELRLQFPVSSGCQHRENASEWFGWSKDRHLGQFTGTTGAQILTPRELASGTQAWAKKDQLTRAAPVAGGMGMHLLQKMGWTPGRGLGKEGTGALQPLLLEVKLDTKGLQAKEEIPQRYNNKGQKVGPPEYNLCFECGPDHKKNFLFKVKVGGTEYQPAVASQNKKQAKADAAQLALQKLGILP
ncbi:Protein SON [Operophtera brumata]|uniref:Protein SON n=1 Tax=Operophtera brumata TaxID=104452 RepID=A0A0L7LKK5_OPEBR|nr:Protein SON [Operophtera brumata]